MSDLTKFQNKIVIIGQEEHIKLQETTSSVDEGEPGKVKLLYDLVFDEVDDTPAGFLLEVPRGSSLDVGMLHPGRDRGERKRCCLEFWYHLPPAEAVAEEIILARRSISKIGDDLSKLCVASDPENFIWELAVLPTGGLELRTHGGTVLNSTHGGDEADFAKASDMMGDFGGDDESVTDPGTMGTVSWQRPDGGGGWNHVCVIFSSKFQEDVTECAVTIFMKGARVASTIAKMTPPGFTGGKDAAIDGIMQKSALLFGVNPVDGLRYTELRVWACERSEDYIKMMMYEYLRAAETKKKFKVKIRNRRGDAAPANAGKNPAALLSPPAKGLLAPPREGGGKLAPPPGDQKEDRPKGLRPPPRSRRSAEEEVPVADKVAFDDFSSLRSESKEKPPAPPALDASGFPSFSSAPAGQADVLAAFDVSNTFFSSIASPGSQTTPAEPTTRRRRGRSDEAVGGAATESPMGTAEAFALATPLSRQVRSSAAAALVRGPPATRHFGGNRGGLPRAIPADRSETGRFGVGNIAICGAEKTVVYKYDRTPPGKTYPIGASGAIISDEMDNEGSEYLCCFLAKDKRMVVFELSTKTVVVELQMTTKLNFWRYLPPQAHGHTLVFMLITPVGGFHWMPLDESPRPRQVWKRGPDLQGKKIVAYEEGGSNGLSGPDARSTVALLLVSTASSGTPLEAWLMPVCGDSRSLCVNSNVLGAALFRPYAMPDAFLPLLVTADTMNEKEVIIEVQPLVESLATGSLGVGDVVTCKIVDQRKVRKVSITPPTLAMGTWPEVFVCCYENLIVATIRRKGLLVAYEFQGGDMNLVRTETFNHYVVDAAVRGGVTEREAEVVLLLSDSDNPRDGRVVSFTIERSQS